MMKNNNGFARKNAEKQSQEPFHVLHKLPPGDSPYVRAKYFQVFTFACILMLPFFDALKVLDS